MTLSEEFEKETGKDSEFQDLTYGTWGYSQDYVEWLEAKINYTRCCTELPMIEELIISEIRREHQKQVDDEVERFLNGNGTDCRLRGFFSEQDLKE